jgi:IS5 family transposase
LTFRRLLDRNKLGEQVFAKVSEVLQERDLKVGTGTIVDATIIGAPGSTKNADKARDPEMHRTRKGQQWHFGMKLHIDVDSHTGSAVAAAENVHDKHPLPALLHGAERRVYGDSVYASQKELITRRKRRTLPTSVCATAVATSTIEIREMLADGSIDILGKFGDVCRTEFESLRAQQF